MFHKIFKDQHQISIIDTSNDKKLYIFKWNFFRPITVYNTINLDLVDKGMIRNSLSSFNTNHGIYFNSNSNYKEILHTFYPKIAKFNPKTKLLTDVGSYQARVYIFVGN